MNILKLGYLLIILTVATKITGQPAKQLVVGDNAPSLHPFKWIKGDPITNFKKDKIYVIEFGATWCVPSIAMISELTTLNNSYEEVVVASIFVKEFNEDGPTTQNPAYVQRVEQMIARQGSRINYSVAVDGPDQSMEKMWLDAANITGIPATFVIDKNGKIAWIGSNPGQLKQTVLQLVEGKAITAQHPTQYSSQNVIQPKTNTMEWASTILEQPDILYFGILTPSTTDQKPAANDMYVNNYRWLSPLSDSAVSKGTLSFTGESLRNLYYMAYADTLSNFPMGRNLGKGIFYDTLKATHLKRSYGKYWYRPLLEMKDSSQFLTTNHEVRNKYNYFLKIPQETASSRKLQHYLQNDLFKAFGYQVSVEKRKVPCWKLVTTREQAEKLMTKTPGQKYRTFQDEKGNHYFKNTEIRDWIFQLEIRYGWSYNDLMLKGKGNFQPPFIDETGIQGEIDCHVRNDIAFKLLTETETGIHFSFEDYRELLKEMGIQLVKSEITMNVVVIRDPSERKL